MSLVSCSGKHKKKYQKFAIVELFRSIIPSKKKIKLEIHQINEYAQELSKNPPNFKKIKALTWNGVPQCIRPKIWKYLLKYALLNGAQEILFKKREQYMKYIKNYWKPGNLGEQQQKIYNNIDGDVKRIGIQFNAIFKQAEIQKILKILLFIWHIRHPASGYVQGMCDLTNLFLIVFLSEYLPFNKEQMKFQSSIQKLDKQTLEAIEADVYWCVCKMLESVLSSYTQGFGGMQEAYSRVQQLLLNIDQQLYDISLKKKSIYFLYLFTISLRCSEVLNPVVGIRLFDTYISYYQQYPNLMIFLLIAMIEKFASKMLTLKFGREEEIEFKNIKQCIKEAQKRASKKSIMDIFTNFLSKDSSDDEGRRFNYNKKMNYQGFGLSILEILQQSKQSKSDAIQFIIGYICNEEAKLFEQFMSLLSLAFHLIYTTSEITQQCVGLFEDVLFLKQNNLGHRLNTLRQKDPKKDTLLQAFSKY